MFTKVLHSFEWFIFGHTALLLRNFSGFSFCMVLIYYTIESLVFISGIEFFWLFAKYNSCIDWVTLALKIFKSFPSRFELLIFGLLLTFWIKHMYNIEFCDYLSNQLVFEKEPCAIVHAVLFKRRFTFYATVYQYLFIYCVLTNKTSHRNYSWWYNFVRKPLKS
jgi:hypothetical protein